MEKVCVKIDYFDNSEDKYNIIPVNPIIYDPSTTTRISQNPLSPDPYENIHVYVSPSKISAEAGEGLFAKKRIMKDQLVCLFNGIRRTKEGRVVRIGANCDGWSDYRITLGLLSLIS